MTTMAMYALEFIKNIMVRKCTKISLDLTNLGIFNNYASGCQEY
jgi:hypothetical protein